MAQKSFQHILLDPSWLHEQAAVGLRCKRLLELLKPSDPIGHLLRPRDVLAHRPSANGLGAPPSSPARHATVAHSSSSSTRLMLGSVAFTLAMSARATSSSAGVGAWRQSSLPLRGVSRATSCWRNSACGLYIPTIRSTPVRGLRKGSTLIGLILKASMVGFTLLSRSYYLSA